MRDKQEELRRKDEGPFYITQEGLEQLRRKLARVEASLPALIEEAQKAAAYGDRSENFEYKDAKKNLRSAQRQIWTLQYQIKVAEIIKPGKGTAGFVQIGSTVVLETDLGQKIFQIVGPHETDPAKGRISHKSPLGAALMNHAKGDIITLQTPNGPKKYKILEVR